MKGNIQCARLIKGSLLDFVLETVDVFVNGSKNDCELVNFNYKEGKVVHVIVQNLKQILN